MRQMTVNKPSSTVDEVPRPGKAISKMKSPWQAAAASGTLSVLLVKATITNTKGSHPQLKPDNSDTGYRASCGMSGWAGLHEPKDHSSAHSKSFWV